MKELLDTLDAWRRDGVRVGRAVVIKTYGSAPRPEGAALLYGADGRIAGSVSGGCVEGAARLLSNAGAKGETFDLLERAAEHLECCDAGECGAYAAHLKAEVARLRRQRRLTPWEHWLLEAAKSLLHPIPGTKHQAVNFFRSTIGEFDETLREGKADLDKSWMRWHEHHVHAVPPYVAEGRI